jgi:toluene monooxygenase system protein B
MSDPQPIPLNAKFGNDFVTQLVVVMSNDTMDEVAKKVAHHVVGRRIRPQNREMAVYYEGCAIPRANTVQEAGIAPMQYLFVNYV